MMNKLISKTLAMQATIIISVYIILSTFSPMQGEDYGLSKFFTSESLYERLLYSIEKSSFQISHWNARLGEQLSIFSLSMPSIFFNIIYLVSLLLLCYVLSQLVTNKEDKVTAFLVAIIVIFAFWPGMELFTWRTVVTGYTIPMIITLFVVSKFMNSSRRDSLRNNNKNLFLYCILGLVSGLSFENVPIATTIFMISVLLFSREALTKCMLVPLSTILGWLILFVAPSTSIRRHYYESSYNLGLSLTEFIKIRFVDVVTFFYETSFCLFIVAIISITFLILMKKLNREVLLLILSSTLVVGSMVASPYTEPRSFMFAWCVMSAVIIDSVYSSIKKENRASFIIFLFFAISLGTLSESLKENYSFYEKSKERNEIIEKNIGLQPCIDGIKIYPITGFNNYRYLNNRDAWFYNNTTQVSTYFGCHVVN